LKKRKRADTKDCQTRRQAEQKWPNSGERKEIKGKKRKKLVSGGGQIHDPRVVPLRQKPGAKAFKKKGCLQQERRQGYDQKTAHAYIKGRRQTGKEEKGACGGSQEGGTYVQRDALDATV